VSPGRRRAWSGPLAAAAVAAVVAAGILVSPAGVPVSAARADRPNVVLILTDDQRSDSLWAMPNVRDLLARPGVTFTDAVVSDPVCCPSRAAILTGSYAHSNDIWRNAPPHGGFESFDDRSTLATWLDRAGYETGLFGKYLNGYRKTDGRYVPPGWDRWFVFRNARYFDYVLSDDGDPIGYGSQPDDYSTTVLSRELTRFVRTAGRPFFAMFAPYAPHQPATPAPGDDAAFGGVPLPPSLAFDEADVADKPAWVQALPRIGTKKAAALEENHRDALRSLLEVDRAVGDLVQALERRGVLDDTIVIFTSDNGLAFGEHRWTTKRVPYEESIGVPLVIRYDAIGRPGSNDDVVANVDLAPTIAALTGVTAPPMDGTSLVRLLRDPAESLARDGVLLEYLSKDGDQVPTYCGFRSGSHSYVRYATSEEELYDIRRDPDQLRNIAADAASRDLLERLRARVQTGCDPPDAAFDWGG
jgi:N-acetylglucosamine-6-sulfatase